VDAVAEIISEKSLVPVIAIGISAGGRSALWLAAKYPKLVDKLILQSSTSFAPWPEGATRHMARIAFNPTAQKYTWQVMHWLINHTHFGLKFMLGNMTTRNPQEVINELDNKQQEALKHIFGQLSSGSGFMNDCKAVPQPGAIVTPTLIIHSKYDKSVLPGHATALHTFIPNSVLFMNNAASHMIWYDSHYSEIKAAMTKFLSGKQSL
jgi:pimeloyl-ACP methyl ester carboxylesterase